MPAPNGDKIKSSTGRMTGNPPPTPELGEKCAKEPIYQQQVSHGFALEINPGLPGKKKIYGQGYTHKCFFCARMAI